MPRKLLLFAAIAVIGTMLVLWWATRDTPPDAGSSEASAPAVAADDSAPRPTRERDTPALPADAASAEISAATNQNPRTSDPGRPNATVVENVPRGTHADQVREPPLEYTLPDGRRVRDFRSPENRKPFDVPPSIHPPGGRKIKPELTALFTDQIVLGIKECGRDVPSTARGPRPRAEGQIVIAIQKEQAQVTSAVFKVTDLTSDSLAETARQCVEQKALSVKVPATGESDLDAYSINLSFAFL